LNLSLTARGYAVDATASGEEAIQVLRTSTVDIVLLDLMMPDTSGHAVLTSIRSWSAVPIIVLSVLADADEKVRALDAGADDYLTKVFDVEELVARIRVALRHRAPPTSFQSGPLAIDFEQRRVTVQGREVALTPTEYELLKALAEGNGKVLTHEALLQRGWGGAYGTERNYLHVYIRRMRHKLELDSANPRLLLTEPGVGYRLSTDEVLVG
jgi:two-component system KDP operon response regulator KdpE